MAIGQGGLDSVREKTRSLANLGGGNFLLHDPSPTISAFRGYPPFHHSINLLFQLFLLNFRVIGHSVKQFSALNFEKGEGISG